MSSWGLDQTGNFLYSATKIVPLPGTEWAQSCAQAYAGEEGKCPPDRRKVQEAWDKIKTAPTEAERGKYIKEPTSLHAENIWIIGTVGELPQPVVARNRLRNVPEDRMWDTAVEARRTATQEQFFLRE